MSNSTSLHSKQVDKYKYEEPVGVPNTGICSFSAFHSDTLDLFTLKRLCKESKQNSLEQAFILREVTILKKFLHPGVYQCVKFLRTSAYNYMVYERKEGKTLHELLRGGFSLKSGEQGGKLRILVIKPELSKEAKQFQLQSRMKGEGLMLKPKQNIMLSTRIEIIKRIAVILSALAEARIAHLHLSPETVFITNSNGIKIIDFGFAVEFKDQKPVDLKEGANHYDQFSADELLHDKAHFSSDLYSLGQIMRYVFAIEFQMIVLTQVKPGKILRTSSFNKEQTQTCIQQLYELMKRLTDHFDKRPRIQEVLRQLEEISNSFGNAVLSQSDEYERRPEMKPSRARIATATDKKTEYQKDPFLMTSGKFKSSLGSQVGNSSQMAEIKLIENSSKFLQSIRCQPLQGSCSPPKIELRRSGNKHDSRVVDQKIKQIIRKVIKKRNIGLILLHLSSYCAGSRSSSSSECLTLSFLLLKKATIIAVELAKFLNCGRCDTIIVEENFRDDYMHSPYRLKYEPLLKQELRMYQDRLSIQAEQIKQTNFIKNNLALIREVDKDKIDQGYFSNCVKSFVTSWRVVNGVLSEGDPLERKKEVQNIFLLSLVFEFSTFEEAFDNLFSDSGLSLKMEPLIRSLDKMKAESIQQTLRKLWKADESTNFSLSRKSSTKS